MILAEMTSPEVDALPRDIVVLMPVASCEQHSLHLPLFTDSLIGQEVARRVHERCPDDVLVLPMQWLGYSQHHIRYPGTISAISETHLLLMMDIVASMVGTRFQEDSHPEQSWRKWCPYLRPAPTFDGALQR